MDTFNSKKIQEMIDMSIGEERGEGTFMVKRVPGGWLYYGFHQVYNPTSGNYDIIFMGNTFVPIPNRKEIC